MNGLLLEQQKEDEGLAMAALAFDPSNLGG